MHRLMLGARRRNFGSGLRRIDQGRVVGRDDRTALVHRRREARRAFRFASSRRRRGSFLARRLAWTHDRRNGRLACIFAPAPDRSRIRLGRCFPPAPGRRESGLRRGFAFSPGRRQGRLGRGSIPAPDGRGSRSGRGFAPARGRAAAREAQLLHADVEGPPHLAPASPLRLMRSRMKGRLHLLAGRAARPRRERRVVTIQFERLPKALQLQNQCLALRADRIVAGFAVPARRASAVMRRSIPPSHGSTLSMTGARRTVFISGGSGCLAAAGCFAIAGCFAAAGSLVTAGSLTDVD